MVLAMASLAGPVVAADAPFRVDPGSKALRDRPELRERLIASPHGYLRFLNVPFADEVCRRFRDLKELPEASLHGDAHVEQYAVTSLGRGLTDFDDSARGPFVLDLVRFGVSLQLAAQQRGWPDEGRKSLDAFLSGYRERLGGHSVIPTPIVVTRVRATFRMDHHDLLRRAEAYIDAAPIPIENAEAAFHQYAVHALKEWPGIPETFFSLKKIGLLRMGIGSALDEKFLIRVEGWTRGDDDDVVLEAKLVREQTGIGCLRQGGGGDPRHERQRAHRLRAVPVLRPVHEQRGKDFLGPRLARRLPGAVDRDVVPVSPRAARSGLRRGHPARPGPPEGRERPHRAEGPGRAARRRATVRGAHPGRGGRDDGGDRRGLAEFRQAAGASASP